MNVSQWWAKWLQSMKPMNHFEIFCQMDKILLLLLFHVSITTLHLKWLCNFLSNATPRSLLYYCFPVVFFFSSWIYMFWIIFSSDVSAHSSPDWILFCYFLSTFLQLGVYCFVKQKKKKRKNKTKKKYKIWCKDISVMCLSLCLKTHSPCYKHFLKYLSEMSQIHYHARSLSTQIKTQTDPEFIIIYCCLITPWIARHTYAKRRWVKSSSARLRDDKFQGQWRSPALLFTPWKMKSIHLRAPPYSYREVNSSKTRRARVRNPSGGRSDRAWRCGAGEHPGQHQQGGRGSPSATASPQHHRWNWSWATAELDLCWRPRIQSSGDFIPWASFWWGRCRNFLTSTCSNFTQTSTRLYTTKPDNKYSGDFFTAWHI